MPSIPPVGPPLHDPGSLQGVAQLQGLLWFVVINRRKCPNKFYIPKHCAARDGPGQSPNLEKYANNQLQRLQFVCEGVVRLQPNL